jgi:hypothetical protein
MMTTQCNSPAVARRRVGRLVALIAVACAIVAGLGLAVAVSQAAAPTAKTKSIVPGKSLGGVSPGQSLSSARAAWGKGKCDNFDTGFVNGGGDLDSEFSEERDGRCLYSSGGRRGFATIYFEGDEETAQASVYRVDVGASFTGSFPDAFTSRAPYNQFRTGRGIRLGSKEASTRRAYPKARVKTGLYRTGFGSDDDRHYVLRAPNGTLTVFDVVRRLTPRGTTVRGSGRVVGIHVVAP